MEKEYTEALAPIGYWSMDNIDGTTVADQSGRGNDCIMDGGLTKNNNWKPGKVGQSLLFEYTNGSNDSHLECGNDSNLDITGPFTIETWVKPNSFTYYPIFIRKGADRYRIGLKGASPPPTNTGNGQVFFRNTIEGVIKDKTSTTEIPLNEWSHIVGTYDGEYMRVYINGILEDNSTAASGSVSTDTGQLIIGSYTTSGTYTFDGYMDETKLYNYALTPYQIAQEYNQGAPIGYWSFNEGEGGSIHDETSNLNHGTLNLGTGGNTVTSTAWQASADCQKGKCMDFDGTDDSVNCGDVSTSDWESLTVSTWIYWDGNTNNGYGVFLYKGASDDMGSHALNSSGKLLVQNGNGNFFSDNDGDISSNEWAYYTYIYNQEEAKEYIYINGVQKGEQSRTGDISQNSSSLEIVRDDNYTYSGLLDEVKMWNYALTADDVKEDYNLGKSLYFK